MTADQIVTLATAIFARSLLGAYCVWRLKTEVKRWGLR